MPSCGEPGAGPWPGRELCGAACRRSNLPAAKVPHFHTRTLPSPLRMGTHPAAPSLLADNGYAGQPLLALLRDRPELLGAALPRFGCDLPFLFKVLSVGTALSIQSHPDKALAERLHAARPEVGGARHGTCVCAFL